MLLQFCLVPARSKKLPFNILWDVFLVEPQTYTPQKKNMEPKKKKKGYSEDEFGSISVGGQLGDDFQV